MKEVRNCPVCNSNAIRLDYDFPNTMKCCEKCGADFIYDGEIILDPRDFIEDNEDRRRWNLSIFGVDTTERI